DVQRLTVTKIERRKERGRPVDYGSIVGRRRDLATGRYGENRAQPAQPCRRGDGVSTIRAAPWKADSRIRSRRSGFHLTIKDAHGRLGVDVDALSFNRSRSNLNAR